ncbi:Mitochondrial intermediate peptidase Short=MIP; AltName: Full=Octapeptidyl aminopeptidase; Flags: Precursor [Serendipita indica DSM 11827]|nr:Mitochondrial intermediate peptidase Short=MIP; AltName: Full=Octapeptidyl aminopeptidase; Flags: Precursor [Serendipita indica DSM 11827]
MLLRRPFRFRGCLVTKSERKAARLASTLAPSVDDKALLNLFHASNKPKSGTTSGLFKHPQMSTPEAFLPVAAATMARANYIVRRIVTAQDEKETQRIVKNIDRLSDLLCGVIDMAELIRHMHPDRAWVDAANNAYDILCEYMNGLNTDVELAAALDRFIENPSFNTLPFEARQTALIFQHDFNKSGVHLPKEKRDKFVQLSSNIISHGRDFLQGMHARKPSVTLTREDCDGVPEGSPLWKLYALKRGMRSSISVEPNSTEARRVLKFSTNDDARRKVYVAQNTSRVEEIGVLEHLLRDRAELAKLVGHESYAHMLLHDKMGRNPENVQMFLNSLMNFSRPRALAALELAKAAKQKRQGLPAPPQIQAWDREAYFPPEPLEPPIQLPVLTPGIAIYAFSRLLRNIYGIYLRPAEVDRAEVWHEDVRKLDIVDESEGVIGWIYLDLFYRNGKASGATHYTLRCSRRVDDDDAESDFNPGEQRELTPEMERQWVLTTEAHVSSAKVGAHQRPAAVISCDLLPGRAKEMDWQDVVTLWHELGHAMHSMIGRTEYGNVAGTRCATDFVELPSILMEHFLTSPEVLSLFFTNEKTTVSPEDMPVAQRAGSPFQAIEAHNHILLACLDQHYHSRVALSPHFDSTHELKHIQTAYGVLPYVEGTSWQTSFGHLFSYGASYYSYLFDRAIASRIWAKIFSNGPLQRENGERFKNDVLRFGGGKQPWDMVGELLDEPMLKEGGLHAMQEVGRWGVDDVAAGGPLA